MKSQLLKDIMLDYKNVLNELEIEGAPAEARQMILDSINKIKYILDKEEATTPAPVGNELDKEVLKAGIVFKNYKELCNFMGWKTTRGNTKKSNLKELETLCKYHIEGQKIIIDGVYQEVLQKVDNRVNNKGNGKRSIYYEDFEILMLNLLENAPSEYLDFTVTQLMQMVGMVNKDYCKYKYSQKILAEETEISTEEINQFYEVHQKLLSQGARTCLNNLKKAYLIHLDEITMIRAFEIVQASKDGNKTKRKYFDRVATKEEIKKILIEKRCLMEVMECKNMNEVYRKNLNLKFHRELRAILEDKYNISFDYTSYRVVLNKEAITKELKEISEIVKAKELKESINNKSYGKSIDDYSKKTIQKIGVIEGFRDLESNIKALSNKLILI